MTTHFKTPQSVTRVEGGVSTIVELNIYDSDHKISWKNSGQGSCEVKVSAHPNAEWLSLAIGEYPYAVNARPRKTYANLDRPAALALRNMLNDTFGLRIEADPETSKEVAAFLTDAANVFAMGKPGTDIRANDKAAELLNRIAAALNSNK